MSKDLAVLGTGAIGSCIGADLTRAGHNVLLIDQWPAHVEAMKAHGLFINMPQEEWHTPVQAVHMCDLCAMHRQLDIVFLASKSYDACWMVQFIKPYLKPDGILVSAQNGLNDEWLAPIIGYQRDIACEVVLSAELFEPGRVKRNTDHAHTMFTVGELHGRKTPRLEEIAQLLSAVGKTETSTNIWGAKWSKLVVNSMRMPFDVITGLSISMLVQNPDFLRLSIKLCKESLQVGKALGYTLEPILGLTAEEFLRSANDVLEQNLLKLPPAKDSRSHARQDILKGRPTEVDYLNGLVVKKGREAGVPTPLNETATSLVHQVEQGILKPDLSNLKLLEHSS